MSQKAAIPFRSKKISMWFQTFHIFSNLNKNQPRYRLPKQNSFFPLIFHSQFSFENTYSPDQHFSENFCLPRFGDYLFRYQEISKDLENAIGSRLAVLKESPMSILNVTMNHSHQKFRLLGPASSQGPSPPQIVSVPPSR